MASSDTLRPVMRRISTLLASSWLLLAASACDDRCAGSAVQARLDAASAGDVVRVDACVVRGRLRVPAGVTLEGAGRARTTIEGGLDVAAGGVRTTVRALRVTSRAGVAVRASGPGGLELADVDVVIERGVGVGVQDVSSGALRSVSIRGGVDAAASATLAPGAGSDVGSYGLVIHRSGSAAERIVVEDLELGDAGPWGTIVDSSAVAWSGGALRGITGVALQITSSDVDVSALEITGVVQGVQPLPAYAVALVESTARLEGIVLDGGEGVGVLAHASEASLVGATVRGHRFGGVFAQRGAVLDVSGGELEGNGLSGIALVDVESATVRDTSVRGTVLRRSILGETTPVDVGDGIHLSMPRGAVTIESTTLSENARAGLLIDVGDAASLARVTLSAVRADALGSALGAIAQQGGVVVESGAWDADVTRLGAAIVNDAALATPLDVSGAIAGGVLPRPDVGSVIPPPM